MWNRDQTRIIARGRSFAEAKRNALAAGASSVLVTRASDRGRWSPHSPPSYSVAVFLAAAS